MDSRTFAKRLRATRPEWNPVAGEEIPFSWIRQMTEEKRETERQRLERLQGDRIERENRVANAELVEFSWAVDALTRTFINPSISALETCKDTEWVEKVYKPILRNAFLPPAPE